MMVHMCRKFVTIIISLSLSPLLFFFFEVAAVLTINVLQTAYGLPQDEINAVMSQLRGLERGSS